MCRAYPFLLAPGTGYLSSEEICADRYDSTLSDDGGTYIDTTYSTTFYITHFDTVQRCNCTSFQNQLFATFLYFHF
ncbi:MAG: hypothetical protein GY757_34080 [bacterium]|nr:hypothetical protein [bacterium]